MKIKNLNGDVIYKDDNPSLGETILNAYRAGANLTGAYFRGAKYADFEIKTAPLTIDNLRYHVLIFDEHMKIGCQLHTHMEWAKFTTQEIEYMAGVNGAKLWKIWKKPLLEMCKAHATQA